MTNIPKPNILTYIIRLHTVNGSCTNIIASIKSAKCFWSLTCSSMYLQIIHDVYILSPNSQNVVQIYIH